MNKRTQTTKRVLLSIGLILVITLQHTRANDLRTAFRKGNTRTSPEHAVEFLPSDTEKNHGFEHILNPGKPRGEIPSGDDDDENDGDLSTYVSKQMTDDGALYDTKDDAKGVRTMLQSIWNVGFATSSSGNVGGGGGGGGGGQHVSNNGVEDDTDASLTPLDASTTATGTTATTTTTSSSTTTSASSALEDLKKRCAAMTLQTGGSPLDNLALSSEKSAMASNPGNVVASSSSSSGILDETDNDTSTRAHHVAILVVLLLITFLLLAGADRIYRSLYARVENKEIATSLRLHTVLDAASRELAVLAFVLIVGYLLLWSGAVESVERDWLGYDAEDANLLVTLFGDVHFLLSSAMLIFMLLTFTLVVLGERTCRMWCRFENVAAEDPQLVAWDYAQAYQYESDKGARGNRKGQAMDFLTLRMEFAPMLYREGVDAKRGYVATKRNCDGTTSQFAHFNFAEYLSERFGRELAKILTVGFKTWILVELFMLLMTLPLLSTWEYQVGFYVGFVYLVLVVHLVVRSKVFRIWRVVVRDAPAQIAARKASKKIPQAPKNLAKDKAARKLHQHKSAELLNKMMHESVRSKTSMRDLFWAPSWWNAAGSPAQQQIFGEAVALQSVVRLVVVFVAISVILVGVAAGVAYNSSGVTAMLLVLVGGYLPVCWILVQLRQVLERYVVLTSVGCFRRPKVLQMVIDENRRNFGIGVAYMIDWIVLARTAALIREGGGGGDDDEETGGGDAGAAATKRSTTSEGGFDTVLMDNFFDSVADKKQKSTVGEADFVRWYRRYKVLCAKSSVDAGSVRALFKLATKEKRMTRSEFERLISTRDRVEMEIMYSRELSEGGDDGSSDRAMRVVASMLEGTSGAGEGKKMYVNIAMLRGGVSKALQKKRTMRDAEALLLPVLKEAGFLSADRKKKVANDQKRVQLRRLVTLLVKYAPTGRALGAGLRTGAGNA